MSTNKHIGNGGKVFKIAILGVGSVGKTTISKNFTGDLRDIPEISMTKGVDIGVKRLIINKELYTLQIWDFAGQKQFRFMIDIFLSGVKGIIYVYDVTDIETLLCLHEFVEISRNYFDRNQLPRVPEILVGNKVDMRYTEVSIADVHNFMTTYKIKKHYLVSGLTSENVTQPFYEIVKSIIESKSDSAYKMLSNVHLGV
ncbi:MAG: Rab family GTPase [Candidatus Heimdallarchaeaceae archaeon]